MTIKKNLSKIENTQNKDVNVDVDDNEKVEEVVSEKEEKIEEDTFDEDAEINNLLYCSN